MNKTSKKQATVIDEQTAIKDLIRELKIKKDEQEIIYNVATKQKAEANKIANIARRKINGFNKSIECNNFHLSLFDIAEKLKTNEYCFVENYISSNNLKIYKVNGIQIVIEYVAYPLVNTNPRILAPPTVGHKCKRRLDNSLINISFVKLTDSEIDETSIYSLYDNDIKNTQNTERIWTLYSSSYGNTVGNYIDIPVAYKINKK